MKNRLSTAIVFIIGLSLSSCFSSANKTSGSDEQLTDISINNEYSLGMPGYMTKTTKLNEEASLQFQNIFKETYVIVIDEDKEAFINSYMEADSYDTALSVVKNYADVQVQSTSANMNVISKSELSILEIDGLNAARIEMDATVEGIKTPITYFFTYVEGEEKLYMIMAWTLQSNKDKYRPMFEKMAKSFKAIKGAPVATNN